MKPHQGASGAPIAEASRRARVRLEGISTTLPSGASDLGCGSRARVNEADRPPPAIGRLPATAINRAGRLERLRGRLSGQEATGPMSGLMATIERRPQASFAAFLALHLLLWTALPSVLYPNLPLDLIEALDLWPRMAARLRQAAAAAVVAGRDRSPADRASTSAYYALAQIAVIAAFARGLDDGAAAGRRASARWSRS